MTLSLAGKPRDTYQLVSLEFPMIVSENEMSFQVNQTKEIANDSIPTQLFQSIKWTGYPVVPVYTDKILMNHAQEYLPNNPQFLKGVELILACDKYKANPEKYVRKWDLNLGIVKNPLVYDKVESTVLDFFKMQIRYWINH